MVNLEIMLRTVALLYFLCHASMMCAQTKAIDNFISDYTDIAFNNEPSYSYLITKWKQGDTIDFFIEGHMKFMSERKFIKYFAELSEWTGLSFQKAETKEEANFHIIFGDLVKYFDDYELDPKLMQEPGLSACYKIIYGSDRLIKSASFCVDASRIELTQVGLHGIYRAMIDCLGMTGEIYNPGSIFHSDSNMANTNVIRRDRQMLKLHYTNQIQAGMNRAEVAQVFNSGLNVGIIMKMKL